MLKKLILFILFISIQNAWADKPSNPIILRAVEQTLIVHGKKSKVFNIVQPNGAEGFIGKKGHYFNVILTNETTVPISIHWHGLILPNDQDGIPYVTQLPIQPGKSHHYYFKLVQSGTYWMHSHYQFHEQQLMTAPLILKDPQDPLKKDKEIVVMLQGFTFKDPKKIFYDLQHSAKRKMRMSTKPDLNDVSYDAYLANRRTLNNPELFTVHHNEKVRLRFINASSSGNFWIDTGQLKAKIIAVDGNNVLPFKNTRFQLAVAQRLDLEITIPKSGGTFPILAQVEGTKQQTGIILVTPGAFIPHFSEQAKKEVPALNTDQEYQLHAVQRYSARPIDARLNYQLTGDMQKYVWKINHEIWPLITPYKIKQGDRVEMIFTNNTNMAHPMHFHGHVFQVTEMNGKRLENGPMRDTILVLPHSTQKVIFNADNPGIWMTHCHVLYHMQAGMMTSTNYFNYPEPAYYRDLIAGKIKE